jgi:outer membrane protein insertion porin family
VPRVEKILIQSANAIDRPRILEQLQIRPGQAFSLNALDRGLKRIAEGGQFQRVDASYDPVGSRLLITLDEVETISEVSVNFGTAGRSFDSFLNQDVLEVVGLGSGDPIFVELLADIRDRVKLRLAERGYPNSRVAVLIEQKGSSSERRLLVDVDAGQRQDIRRIEFVGFKRKDAQALVALLKGRNEFDEFFKSFSFPATILMQAQGKVAQKIVSPESQESDQESLILPVEIPFDQIALTQVLSQWSQKVRENGFYEIQSRLETYVDAQGFQTLRIVLNKGSRVRIVFRDNILFWSRELRSLILGRTLRLGVPFNVIEAQRSIERLYRSKGHSQVKVEVLSESKGDKILTFKITEGPARFLRSLRFDGLDQEQITGLKRVDVEWLKPLVTPLRPIYFDEALLRSKQNDLLKLIRDRGYLQARILETRPMGQPESRWVDWSVALQAGPRFLLSSVEVDGNFMLSQRELDEIFDFELGASVAPSVIQASLNRLESEYRESGFLDVKVPKNESEIFRTNLATNDVALTIKIEPGPQTFVGRIFVQGLQKTKAKVVTREVVTQGVKEGQPWIPSLVLQSEQRLQGLGIFSNVRLEAIGGRDVTPLQSSGAEVSVQRIERDLKVGVSERAFGALEFVPGFRTDLGLVAFSELSYRNLGGWNRAVSVRAQVSRKFEDYQFLVQKYSITYLEPYILNDPTRMRLSLSFAKEDQVIFVDSAPFKGFNSQDVSFAIGLDRQLSDRFRLTQNLYTISLPKIFDIADPDESIPVDRQNYRIGSVGTVLTYDTRDNVFNTTKGLVSTSSYEYSAPWLGSNADANFVVARQSVILYVPIALPSVLACSISFARLWGLGRSQGVPENKRLFLGGRTSIRSLRERALSSDKAGVLDQDSLETKIEYRQPVLKDFGIAYFFDGGVVRSLRFLSGEAAISSGFRTGIGVGFRYVTPVGPLALDFAFNPNPNADNAEERLQIQFNIGSF